MKMRGFTIRQARTHQSPSASYFQSSSADELGLDVNAPAAVASAGEFLLEALYVNNCLTKSTVKGMTLFIK